MVIVERASMMGVLETHVGFALTLFQGWRGGNKIVLENVPLKFQLSEQVHNLCFMWSLSRHLKNRTYLKLCLQMMVLMKTEMFMFYL